MVAIQTFACKKCKKCFRKDAAEFEESDEYCPHCDNHFVLEAVTPKPSLQVEGDDARVDNRCVLWIYWILDTGQWLANNEKNAQGRPCAAGPGKVHLQLQGYLGPDGLRYCGGITIDTNITDLLL